MMKRLLTISLILLSILGAKAQGNVVDQVIAIVGNKPILKSDIENEFIRFQSMGMLSGSKDFKSEIFEELLIQKLLLAQAKRDSITVSDSQVENQLNARIDQYINKIGSKEKLEKYFKKTIIELKSEFRSDIRDMMITEQMKNSITSKITTTPAEIRRFYNKIDKDSIQMMPEELEIQQIVRIPIVDDKEEAKIIEKLRNFRKRINNGENFATLAVLYSDDPGSASRGGELGYTPRSKLLPEFANVAFNLKTDKISKIVKTEYGYHIIQLIDRKGERINVRHILIKPKISAKSEEKCISVLDSITKNVRINKMEFDKAAAYFSEDKETRQNGGLIINPRNGSSRITLNTLSQLSPTTASLVEKMKIGQISEPFKDLAKGKTVYKILRISKIHPAHKANLNEDWSVFRDLLIMKKKKKILDEWIKKHIKDTYIHIDKSYQKTDFKYKNWIK